MMLIGFDGSRAFTQNRTGTENYSFQLLQHLAKIDRQNQYLVYLRPGNQFTASEWPDNFKFKLINYQSLWTQFGLAAELIKAPPDVLFVTAHTYPLFHLPNLKIVMTVHDLGAEYLPGLHQLKQQLYLRWITNHQLKGATKLIAVSEATKKDLIGKANCRPNQIQVIYEGIDNAKLIYQKDDALSHSLKQFGLEKNSYFLFVGTIQPRKNLGRLIEAFSKLPGNSSKLVLAGSKGWNSDKIYTLPAKLGLADRVIFLGRVDDSQLSALYQGAIALTFASLFEGFGLPILEAFSNGCPVITSNVSSMPEIAGKAAILIDPQSTEELSAAMEFVLKPGVRPKMISDGLTQAKKFSWQKTAQETLQLLETVVKSDKG